MKIAKFTLILLLTIFNSTVCFSQSTPEELGHQIVAAYRNKSKVQYLKLIHPDCPANENYGRQVENSKLEIQNIYELLVEPLDINDINFKN